ncbi:MAG TPA: cytochrome b/b6 domain-containing protein [Chryseolinea sp.]
MPSLSAPNGQHKRWVRLSHWIIAMSFVALVFSGYEMLMTHPRLYWGEVGNDLTPALLELPVSRNYRHGGWTQRESFFDRPGSPISAGRTYDIFNQNGWGRSLHFLAGWFLFITGAVYLLAGAFTGHFRKRLLPRRDEFTWRSFLRDVGDHLRMQIPKGGGPYGLLQKCTYVTIVFFLLPLMVVTGVTMSPAVTAAYPFLLKIFGGVQSARTIHFFAFVALVLFLVVHVVMVIRSGFRQQMRGMTLGK